MDSKKLLPIGLLLLVVAIIAGMAYVRSTMQQGAKTDDIVGVPTPGPLTPEEETVVTQDAQVHKPLTLTVSTPTANSTVTTASVTVRGKTAPKAEVFINEYELVADAAGNFSKVVPLDEGENIIIVMANDADGNVAEAELIVTYSTSQ